MVLGTRKFSRKRERTHEGEAKMHGTTPPTPPSSPPTASGRSKLRRFFSRDRLRSVSPPPPPAAFFASILPAHSATSASQQLTPPSTPDNLPAQLPAPLSPSPAVEAKPTLPSPDFVFHHGQLLSVAEDMDKTVWSVEWGGKAMIVKGGTDVKPQEAEWTIMARSMTGSTLVPKVYGVLTSGLATYIYFELLPGKQLMDSVVFFSSTATSDPLVRQLRDFFHLLHGIKAPAEAFVGGFGGENLAAITRSVDGDPVPRLSSSSALHAWAKNRFLERYGNREEWDCDLGPILDDSSPLVFCHGDAAPRNILVDGDRLSGIIDWEWAGWYPSWLEAYGASERLRLNSPTGLVRCALCGPEADKVGRYDGLVKLRRVFAM